MTRPHSQELETLDQSSKLLRNNFRQAAKWRGKYCTEKNELRVLRGKDVYRFILRETSLYFAAPNEPEVELFVAADATVSELKRAIPETIKWHQQRHAQPK
ncbi:MAG: hypothetical protein KJO79_02545 [Verrucomicrobiae bacterium]|nr:hypothetical protein [Verrucomicrobiae bacterium]NNJ86033.1 hypothetical protein [Akkermansiaceae bacterium]